MSDAPSFHQNLIGIPKEALARFESRFVLDSSRPTFEKLGPCWVWTGSLSQGYGRISIRAFQLAPIQIHCLAYRLVVGPIPKGHDVHHECEFRPCGNPAHLVALSKKQHWAVTPAHNGNATHCPAGHPYDEINTYLDPDGARRCRECHRIRYEINNRAAREAVPHIPLPIATHCPNGHEYRPDNTQYWKGERRCRRCKADWTLQKYKANHEANKAARRAKWAANAEAINADRRLKRQQAYGVIQGNQETE